MGWTGTTTSPASDTVAVAAAYGDMAAAGKWCRLYIGSPFSAATVTPSGWSKTVLSYNALTGSSTGVITMGGGMTIQMGGCVVTVANGTVLPFSGQSIGSPTALTMSVSALGIHYTSSGCSAFGIPASGTSMTYSGATNVPGLSVG